MLTGGCPPGLFCEVQGEHQDLSVREGTLCLRQLSAKIEDLPLLQGEDDGQELR